MITRSKYIIYEYVSHCKNKTLYTERLYVGVVSIVYDKGKFGVGVSFCSLEDDFDKSTGMAISIERAVKDLENNPKTMNQMRKKIRKSDFYTKLNPEEYSKDALRRFGGVKVPSSLKERFKTLNNVFGSIEERVASTLDNTLDSMRNALVIEKIKEDTERA